MINSLSGSEGFSRERVGGQVLRAFEVM